MKNKIKEIHNKLSQSKIDSFDSAISTSSFSSVLKDRFVSELKKMNIFWDLNPTSINKLIKKINSSKNTITANKISKPQIISNRNISVGIDIQLIKNMPISNDPWEDQFYLDNFNKNEIAHCLKKKNIYESFAGIYALKEAVYKIDQTDKKEVNITFSKNGKPLNDKYSVSISHDQAYAIAVAVFNSNNCKSEKIDYLNSQIKRNEKIIKNLEFEFNNLKNLELEIDYLKKSKKNMFLYFLIACIFSYILFREFFYYSDYI